MLGFAEHSQRRALKRYFEGWSVHGDFAVFLSHFKIKAAAEARILKNELVRSFRVKQEQVFLDSDNLTDLRQLLKHIADSDAIALLYTKGVLSRPWCLLELMAAVENKVPIFVIRVANAFGDSDPAAEMKTILDDLPGFLARKNPSAEATLKTVNHNPTEIANVLKPVLAPADGAAKLEVVTFDPHQGTDMLKAQISQMAEALVKIACPQNKALMIDFNRKSNEPWPGTKHNCRDLHHPRRADSNDCRGGEDGQSMVH